MSWARVAAVSAIVLGVVGSVPPALALDPDRRMTQYSHRMWQEELPQNSVHTVLQTADGYLWLGTYEGLVRFDGVRFVVFDARRTGDLPGGTVNHLHEDRERRLWISTDHGLARHERGHFIRLTTDDGLPGEFVNATVEAADGSVWIATNGGLARWKDGAVEAVTLPEGSSGEQVRAMAVEGDGLWLASSAQLIHMSGAGSRRYGPGDGLPAAPPRAVLVTADGDLYVGSDRGLFRRAGEGFEEVWCGLGKVPAIRSLFEDRGGVVWVGTEQRGLLRLSGGEVDSLGAHQGLSHDYVRSITEDHEGGLWVGTNSGLNQLRDAKVISYSTREGLSGDFARTVFQDRDGVIWIGTDGGGIDRLEGEVFTNYSTASGLANDSVRAIAQTPDDSLWIGTRGGISRFSDGAFETLGSSVGLSNLLVRAILVDSRGVVWVGTEDGLNAWRGNRFQTYTTDDGLAGNDVRALYEDSGGRLWVGTFTGVSRFENGVFTTFRTTDGLSSNIAFSFFEDRPGELWIGTDSGLNLLRDGAVSVFTSTENGLFDDKYFRMLADDRGAVWTSSNHGLARIELSELRGLADGTRQRVRPLAFDASDGMRTSQCNGASQPAGWKTADGHLWFPTPRGVVEVEPDNLRLNPHPPQVHVEEVVVDGRVVAMLDPARIEAGAENFELHFTALSFAAPEWVRFRYRLEGFDREWIDAGSRRVAYYTNLSPGRYRFEVVATNDDGVGTDDGATFVFDLRPAWWQTVWARIGLVFGLAAAVWLGVRLRLGAMARRTAQLEAMVAERTAELADKVRQLEVSERNAHISERRAVEASRAKSIFLSNMSHELRTPLNSIIGFASILKSRLAKADDQRLLRFVNNIHGSGEHLLAIINDILDLSKIEAGRMEVHVDDFELQPLLDDVRRVMSGLSHRRGIEISIDGDDTPIAMSADRSKLKQVLFNLVSNAVKFSPGGATVVIRTALLEAETSPLSEPTVMITVRDRGPGIARRHHEVIFEEFRQVDGSASREHEGTGLGLALVRRLLELQGGQIGLESELGEGSTFTVWIPRQVKVSEIPVE